MTWKSLQLEKPEPKTEPETKTKRVNTIIDGYFRTYDFTVTQKTKRHTEVLREKRHYPLAKTGEKPNPRHFWKIFSAFVLSLVLSSVLIPTVALGFVLAFAFWLVSPASKPKKPRLSVTAREETEEEREERELDDEEQEEEDEDILFI